MTQQAASIGWVRSPFRSRLWTLTVLAYGFAAIAAYCFFFSRGRIFWSDELFGWMLLDDPSLTHMLAAWRDGADGGGMFFYLLGRAWLAIFGHTALAFRAFSAAGCFLGFSAAWFALRRFYRPEIVALSLLATWFGSRTLVWQMVQTRFYGLLLGAVCLALLASLRSAREALPRVRPRTLERRGTLVLTFVAHALLVGTHPLGVLYSAILLLAAALADWTAHRRRPLFFLASLLPWTILLLSRSALRNTAAVGRPWFWTVRPTSDDLSNIYQPDAMPFIVYAALALLLITFLVPSRRRAFVAALGARRDILLPGFLLSLTPVFVWLVSQRGTSLFVDRYLLPFTLGIAIFTAEALTALFPNPYARMRVVTRFAAAALTGFVLFCIGQDSLVDYPRQMEVPPHDFTPGLAALLPPGRPVVMERVDVFDGMRFYQETPDRPVVLLLDWPMAIDPSTPRGQVSGFHEMQGWQREGYFASSIRNVDEFLAGAQDFTALDSPDLHWMRGRILNRPEWKATQIADYQNGLWSESVWEVHRR